MQIQKAAPADLDAVMELIRQRIAWMDARRLEQWNRTDYLICYPRSYFLSIIQRGEVYVAVENDRRLGVMALFASDPRWQADRPAFYVHHLATSLHTHGLGAKMLEYAKQLACEQGKSALRLDAQKSNPRLNAYYERLGFRFVEEMQEGAYIGIKRELLL